ncbi:MAG: branched-chain amino acid ABC transporter permease [Bacteroidota bacterium]
MTKERTLSPKRSSVWPVIGLGGILLLVPSLVGDEFYIHTAIMVYLNIIGATGLNMIMKTGRLSLAQAGFVSVGAYSSALLALRLGLPFPVTFLGAGVIASALAFAVGAVILRLQGVYFLLITYCLGETVRLVFTNGVNVFGGANGISGIPGAVIDLPWLATPIEISSKQGFYYLTLIVAIVVVVFTILLYSSHVGRAFQAISEAEGLTECLGIDTTRYKVAAFALAGFFSGLQGALFAHYFRFIAPQFFGFWESVDLVVMNVVGGVNTYLGPIIGSLVLTPLPELLRGYVDYQRILYGVILILAVAFMPGGIAVALSGCRLPSKPRRFRRGGAVESE